MALRLMNRGENRPNFRNKLENLRDAFFDARYRCLWGQFDERWGDWVSPMAVCEISCLDHLSLPCKIATTVCKLSEKIKDLKMFQSFYWEI